MAYEKKTGELSTFYIDPDIIAIVKAKRLRWLEQVHQREEGTRLKEALMGTPQEMSTWKT